jgi:hypothetical protein
MPQLLIINKTKREERKVKTEEELLAKERLARRTFCPYCGANPGHSCYAVLSYGSALFPKRELPAHIHRHENVDRRQPVTKLMRFVQPSVYKPELVGAKFFTSPNGEFALVAEEQRTEDAITSARRIRADRMMSPEAIFWRKFRQMTIRGVARKVAKFSTQEEASAFAKEHSDTYIFPHKFVRNSHTVDENGKNVYSRTYYYKVLYR